MAARLIGIGSVHGGDRLGWLAAERLGIWAAGRPVLRGVEVFCAGPTDLPRLGEGAALLVVDAWRGPAPTGEVRCVTPAGIAPGNGCSSHGLDLGAALSLVQVLNPGLPPPLVLAVALGGADAGPALERAWPALKAALVAWTGARLQPGWRR